MEIKVIFTRVSDEDLKKFYKRALISLIYGCVAGIAMLFLFGYSLGGIALSFLCIFVGYTLYTFYKFLIGIAVLYNKLESLKEKCEG